MYTCIKSFEPVACHLELTILSGKCKMTEHAQSSVIPYFRFFQHNSLAVLHFYQVMGRMPKKPAIY